MTLQEIMLAPRPARFGTVLNGQSYVFSLLYRDADIMGGWTLDIFDAENNPLICGIPLVTGANLLAQFSYLGFDPMQCALAVITDGNFGATPTFENLGVQSHLYWALNE